jgi:hypothetical protein
MPRKRIPAATGWTAPLSLPDLTADQRGQLAPFLRPRPKAEDQQAAKYRLPLEAQAELEQIVVGALHRRPFPRGPQVRAALRKVGKAAETAAAEIRDCDEWTADLIDLAGFQAAGAKGGELAMATALRALRALAQAAKSAEQLPQVRLDPADRRNIANQLQSLFSRHGVLFSLAKDSRALPLLVTIARMADPDTTEEAARGTLRSALDAAQCE